MEQVADRYRRLAAAMTDRIDAVPDDAWGRRTPCDEWTARELVGHLLDVHGRFESLVGRELVSHPPVDDDPAAAWAAVRDQMQADLDDPAKVGEEYVGRFGRSTFGQAVDGFVCFDLVVHGWDLAHATGLDETMDPQEVERSQAMVDAMGETMLENGVIRAPVEPAQDASAQDRLLCALGRDPQSRS
ncbi:MAG: TIGR03086 family protein [Nocardioidaceae bacterium]|nr:TIGR03086 family protein [Nocardioidaceae bacterium]NUS50252.1 TIGR03086 family protein [Nocardioidaceae bacterium]